MSKTQHVTRMWDTGRMQCRGREEKQPMKEAGRPAVGIQKVLGRTDLLLQDFKQGI